MRERVDEFGRAFAGSQLQIQTYVNRRPEQLNAAIFEALPDLADSRARLKWVSPLEEGKFAEYLDASFLAALGLAELSGMLAEFWPQGGPRWDALARVEWDGGQASGALLIEAKSYPMEMYSNGCRASESSRDRIVSAMGRARLWLEAGNGDWTGSLYQFANRLAHLYFLREVAGVPAWFVNVCFTADPHRPTPMELWKEALEVAKEALGLGQRPVPYCADIFLEAAGRELFQNPPRVNGVAVPLINAGRSKEWRFLLNVRTGCHQFLGFANANGSSSLRYFDAESGERMGKARSGRKSSYQEVFVDELAASVPVVGPSAVSAERIPPEWLPKMRESVGLSNISVQPVSSPRRSSILAGVDEIVDRALGITEVGQTTRHYEDQGAYSEIVKRPPVDGPKWIEPMYRRIVANWPGTPCRSGKNWRWEKKLRISEPNDSREKRFEKTLVRECAEWYNMIPVASGLLPDVEEGGRRIDLARCCGPGWFEFIELKVGDRYTPLHAAIQILGYGLIYLFSRRYARELGYDPGNILLAANRISLKVLAPRGSYSKGSLASFEKEVNRGLRVLTSEDETRELTMDFQFEQLPRDFDPTCKTGSSCEIMNRRQALYDVAEA